MDEIEADSGTEALVVQPPAPESAGGSGFNYGLAGLMVVVVLLVCIQNIWLRRRAEREQSRSDGGGTKA
jgi:hypothetical protein